ncbi:phage tail fiber protein [Oleiharenicola lentus]|uniref:phage tail fiber protein n=1 Tax=Oleiharenicola lentus TaxID=2508720 RepID=UPI003F6732A8
MLLSYRQTILGLALRTVPAGYTRPASADTLKVCLFTTLPADDGSGGVEAAGSGYASVIVAALDANFSLVGDLVANIAEIQFPVLTGALPEIVGWGIRDSGNVIRWAQPCGDTPQAFVVQASVDTLTRAAHGLTDGMMARVFALDGLPIPAGLALNTTYYVVNSAAGTLKLSATIGGAAIDITADGAVFLRRWYGKAYAIDDRPIIPAGGLKFRLSA